MATRRCKSQWEVKIEPLQPRIAGSPAQPSLVSRQQDALNRPKKGLRVLAALFWPVLVFYMGRELPT